MPPRSQAPGPPAASDSRLEATERERMEQLLQEQRRLLKLIVTGRPLDECLSSLSASVPRLKPRARASVLLANDQREQFFHAIAPELLPSFGKGLEGAPINEPAIGACGTAVLSGKPVTCADIANDTRWSKPWRDLCIANGIRACHSEPVLGAGDAVLASFMLCFDQPGEPDAWDLRLAEFGSHITSVALERDQSNRALRESEQRYRTLFESIDEAFCVIEMIFDADSHPVDYRFVEINPAFERHTGIENGVGRRMREIAPDHEEHWFEIYGRVALTGKAERFQNPAAKLHRWFDVYAFRIGRPEQRRVAILFNDITERKRTEEALHRSEQRLTEANASLEERVAERTAKLEQRAHELRRLASELTTVEQRERRRLAHTLHNNLQQLLVAARLRIEMAGNRSENRDARDQLEEAKSYIDQTIEGMRTLALELSPPMLYHDGLVPALEWLARRLEEDHGLRIDLRAGDVPPAMSDDLRAFVFQAIRELTFNVIKHAETKHARIDLGNGGEAGWLTVTVADGGKGCDLEAMLRKEGDGFGVMSIHERLHALRGTFDVQGSTTSGGCRITMQIPLTPSRKRRQMIQEPDRRRT